MGCCGNKEGCPTTAGSPFSHCRLGQLLCCNPLDIRRLPFCWPFPFRSSNGTPPANNEVEHGVQYTTESHCIFRNFRILRPGNLGQLTPQMENPNTNTLPLFSELKANSKHRYPPPGPLALLPGSASSCCGLEPWLFSVSPALPSQAPFSLGHHERWGPRCPFLSQPQATPWFLNEAALLRAPGPPSWQIAV